MLSGEIRMRINYCVVKRVFIILLLTMCYFQNTVTAQTVWENHNKEVYNYLSRMAQKGIIIFDDNIRPLSRKYIAGCLDSLSNNSGALSVVEKKELAFYSREYGVEMDSTNPVTPRPLFFKRDPYQRWRSFLASNRDMLLAAEPVFTASTLQGGGRSINRTSSGLNFYGYIGKHWGFQFFYDDITEAGTGIDFVKQGTTETGYVKRDTVVRSSLNYSHFRGSISYSFRNGSVSFGQDYLLWGYGENGKMVLSDKAPTFPYIRFDYQLFPWLRFNYSHAWLSSNIVDTFRTYGTNTGGVFNSERILFVPKFLATHSVQIKPFKGLDLFVGESIVYSDRLNVGYLFPLTFFKVYDNIANNGNINAGSNGQLFAQVSSRNHIPKTHLYATLFIDEIRIATIFNRNKSRNQAGITIGASVTDLVVPYLTAGIEYTRIQPFVYRNLLPAQNYTSHDYVLGDWMGSNADRLIYTLKYTPLPKLKCLFRYQSSRKGSEGTIAQQYFQQPQPGFLFGLQKKQQELSVRFSYEWLNNLSFNAFYTSLTDDNRISLKKTNYTSTGIGFTYGL